MSKKSKSSELEHERDYVEFLRTRLNSDHYRQSVSSEEYEATRKKYDRAKFKLKLLTMKGG